MENICFKTQGVGQRDLGTILDSKFVENHNAREVNTNSRDKVSIAFATSMPNASCSKLYSLRIENMMASRSEFEIELEFRTTHSKVHWSELSCPQGALGNEELGLDHCQYFEKLQKDAHWGPFCNKVTNVVLGRKLEEGAQVDIYESQVTFAWDHYKKIGSFLTLEKT